MRCEGFCGKTFEKDSENNISAAKVRMIWYTEKLGSQTAKLCFECVNTVAKTLHPNYSYFLKPLEKLGITKVSRQSEFSDYGDFLNKTFDIKIYN